MVVGEDIAVLRDDKAGAGRRPLHLLTPVVGGDQLGGDAHGGVKVGGVDLGQGQGLFGGDVGYADHRGGVGAFVEGGTACQSGDISDRRAAGHAAQKGADQSQSHQPAGVLFGGGSLRLSGRGGNGKKLVAGVVVIVHKRLLLCCFLCNSLYFTIELCPENEETLLLF